MDLHSSVPFYLYLLLHSSKMLYRFLKKKKIVPLNPCEWHFERFIEELALFGKAYWALSTPEHFPLHCLHSD